ncbi:MAG TPA: phospho-sugar mutase [Polyangiales bacterium]|nr:phospho-sugar mutase [Polyangiales bacterium]
MNAISKELLERAQRFRADDPDPDTQRELDVLLARAVGDERAHTELQDRFAARLSFGTAGLRGLLGAGDNRMNQRVVAQTTAALCAELIAQVPDAAQRGICVAFDGRHKSRAFASEVQAIAAGAGFEVHAFEEPVPTPILAFSVLATGAAAGVMVTASHNPAAYNGYKVYWSDGAQLNTPHDTAIAKRIDSGPGALELPRLQPAAAKAQGRWHSLAAIPQRYLAELQHRLRTPCGAAAPRVAYTAMHGVGEAMARAALQLAGVDDLASVAEQAEPDPDFPTVSFPNPEEPGALDRLLKLAQQTQAHVALANDPDADRLAAAIPTSSGSIQALTGNELGALLCDYLLSQTTAANRFIVTTIVTTPLAARIARAHGAEAETTLTGFKWIIARALERQAKGHHFILGFEEALGYCIGDLVKDKDGIAAAAHTAQMTRWHASKGRTLWQALQALYVKHGLWKSRQVSIALTDANQAKQLHQNLAELRKHPPSQIAGLTVTEVQDLEHGPNPNNLPKSDVCILQLQDNQRIAIRPSGTEPKLKLYLDVTEPANSQAAITAANQALEARLDQLEQALKTALLPSPN